MNASLPSVKSGWLHRAVAQRPAFRGLARGTVQDQPRQALDQPLRVARQSQQPFHVGAHRRLELGGGHHAVDQADPQRLVRGQQAGRVQKILGPRGADEVDQALDLAQAVGEADPGRCDAQPRVGGGKSQVAGHRQPAPAADAVAGDLGDGRLLEPREVGQGRLHDLIVVVRGGLVGEHLGELGDVRAGRERWRLTADDDDTDGRIAGDRPAMLRKRLPHRA